MRKSPLALAAALGLAVATSAWTHDADSDVAHRLHRDYDHGLAACDLDSPFALKVGRDALAFTQTSGTPRRVELRGGRLIVDGRDVALSAADRARIVRFEAEVRAVLPEVLGLALEAVDIAFGAVHEVVRTFVRDGESLERIAQRLASAQREISTRIETRFADGAFDERGLEQAIEQTVAELVPMVAAEIAAVAVAAALSGDTTVAEDLERRAERLEATIEREVEQRAAALERRANALCPRIAALATLESELDVRLADGARLDLVRPD
jgi:hypothetical protein